YLWFVLFFFSSRRRHTRSKRDWSSDVCSSDLHNDDTLPAGHEFPCPGRLPLVYRLRSAVADDSLLLCGLYLPFGRVLSAGADARSEERRVGKECGCVWGRGGCRMRGDEGDDGV